MGVYQAKENNEMEADGTLSKHAQQKKMEREIQKGIGLHVLRLGKFFLPSFLESKCLIIFLPRNKFG